MFTPRIVALKEEKDKIDVPPPASTEKATGKR